MAGRDDRPPGEKSRFANQGELSPADRAALGEGEPGPAPEDRIPGTLDDDDATRMDVSAVPASERTARSETSGYEETIDGLDDTEETVRQQAEDRALGDDEDFRP